MADTLSSVEVSPEEYTSVDALTQGAILQGSEYYIQNLSKYPINAVISISKPSSDFDGWKIPADLSRPLIVTSGENTCWLKGFGKVSIQPA